MRSAWTSGLPCIKSSVIGSKLLWTSLQCPQAKIVTVCKFSKNILCQAKSGGCDSREKSSSLLSWGSCSARDEETAPSHVVINSIIE